MSDIILAPEYRIARLKNQETLPITQTRWKSLKDSISSVGEPAWVPQSAASALIGISASAALAIPLTTLTEPQAAMACVIAIAAFLLSTVFFYLAWTLKRQRQESITRIITLMAEIESEIER